MTDHSGTPPIIRAQVVQVNAFCGYAIPMDPEWLGTAPNPGATIWPLVCFDRVRTRYNPELKHPDTQKKDVRNDVNEERLAELNAGKSPKEMRKDLFTSVDSEEEREICKVSMRARMQRTQRLNPNWTPMVCVGYNKDWFDLTEFFIHGDIVLLRLSPTASLQQSDVGGDYHALHSWKFDASESVLSQGVACLGGSEYVSEICKEENPELIVVRTPQTVIRFEGNIHHTYERIREKYKAYFGLSDDAAGKKHRKMGRMSPSIVRVTQARPSVNERARMCEQIIKAMHNPQDDDDIDQLVDKIVCSPYIANGCIELMASESRPFELRAVAVPPVEQGWHDMRWYNPYSNIRSRAHRSCSRLTFGRRVEVFFKVCNVEKNITRIICVRPMRQVAQHSEGIIETMTEQYAIVRAIPCGKVFVHRDTLTSDYNAPHAVLAQLWRTMCENSTHELRRAVVSLRCVLFSARGTGCSLPGTAGLNYRALSMRLEKRFPKENSNTYKPPSVKNQRRGTSRSLV